MAKKNKQTGEGKASIEDRTKRETRVKGRLKKTVSRVLSEKMLRKPTAKLPSYSARGVITNMGKQQGALVREVENPYADPVQDNRSLFFKQEFAFQKKKQFGGFI